MGAAKAEAGFGGRSSGGGGRGRRAGGRGCGGHWGPPAGSRVAAAAKPLCSECAAGGEGSEVFL